MSFHLRTIGTKGVTCGSDFLLSGSGLFGQFSAQPALSSISETINSCMKMVSGISNFNINVKFINKELPVRAVTSAHWSGPVATARLR